MQSVYSIDLKLHNLIVRQENGCEIIKDGQVQDDIIIEGTKNSLHVINSEIYGFTCALPLAEHLTKLISDRI